MQILLAKLWYVLEKSIDVHTSKQRFQHFCILEWLTPSTLSMQNNKNGMKRVCIAYCCLLFILVPLLFQMGERKKKKPGHRHEKQRDTVLWVANVQNIPIHASDQNLSKTSDCNREKKETNSITAWVAHDWRALCQRHWLDKIFCVTFPRKLCVCRQHNWRLI